jgi:hypothetical protein
MFSKTAGSLFAFVVLIQASVLHAQPTSSDAAIAQSLFDEGRKLMAEKKYAEACPRLERSYKLDPATGTLLNVAVCHEDVGKTATAWNEFRDVVAKARRENREDRAKFAQEHIDRLKDRLSTLTVKQAGQEVGLAWKLDDANVGTEALGIALPIDPGHHTVEAVAPGKTAWKATVDIVRDGETKTIEIPALALLPAPVIQRSRGPSGWVFVTGSVALLGFGAMALGGIEALSSWSTRTAACGIGGDPNACSQAGLNADGAARTWAIVSDIGLGVGATAAIATIIIAAVTVRGKGTAKEHASFAPVLTPTGAGIALGGAF